MYQQAEWLTGWVPDYIIILRCKSGKKKLILLEMKRKKNWKISPRQKLRNKQLLEADINTYIANGAIEAVRYIQKIMIEN